MEKRKHTYILFLMIVLNIINGEAFCQLDFSPAGRIVDQIRRTHFPADTFQIVTFGAKGDGVFDSRPAIIQAIDACSAKGGGVVEVPSGKFFCKGPISLKSNVNLYLSDKAILFFSSEPDDYLPAVFTRWEGVEIYNYSPLIYTLNQENVALSGKGTIDGNTAEKWIPFRDLQGKAQNKVRELNDLQVPVSERRFGDGDYLRPSFIQFINCKRILIEGITLINSPFWMLHPVYCSDIIVRNVKFNSLIINNDGIDFDSSTNGLVEGCSFTTGDDAIVFKSGRDRDGWRINKPTENIVARNCTAPQVLHGIAFGSEMSAGVENVYIENFKIGNVQSEAIQFKANKDRGGFIKNIYIRDIEVDRAGQHLFFFTNSYQGYRGGNSPSEFYNIHLENIICNYANYVIQLQGLEASPLHNISIENVEVKKADHIFDRKEFYKDIIIRNVTVAGKEVEL